MITQQNFKDLNQDVLHLWSKFSDPKLTHVISHRVGTLKAWNLVKFDCEVKFDLEGQGQLPSNTIGILTKVFCTFGPNLVILT